MKSENMNNILEKSLLTTALVRVFGLRPVKIFSALLPVSIVCVAYLQPVDAMDAQQAAEYREHVNRGNMLLGRRLFDQAIAEYEAAEQIDPSSNVAQQNMTLAHNNWGIYLYSQRKYPEAKTHWDEALKLSPNDANVKRNLKILDIQLKQMEREKPPAPADPAAPPKAEDWNPLKDGLDRNTKPIGSPTATKEPSASTSNSGSVTLNVGTSSGQSGAATQDAPPAGTETAKPDTASAVIILGGSGSSNSTTTSTNTNQNPAGGYNFEPAGTNESAPSSIRIIGGSSGTASIIGGGSTTRTPPPSTTGGFNVVGGGGTGRGGVPINMDRGGYQLPGSETSSPPPARSNFPPVKPVTFAPSGEPIKDPFQTPAATTSNGNSGNSSTDDGDNTVEEQLGKIENKVYGKVTKNMPILKRIEKLEVETMGKKQSGSISNRLKELTQTYGL